MRALVVSTTAAELELAPTRCGRSGWWRSRSEHSGWRRAVDVARRRRPAATTAASYRLDRWEWRFVDVDESVADGWRDHAAPVRIDGDLVICPAWVPFAAPQRRQRVADRTGFDLRARRSSDHGAVVAVGQIGTVRRSDGSRCRLWIGSARDRGVRVGCVARNGNRHLTCIRSHDACQRRSQRCGRSRARLDDAAGRDRWRVRHRGGQHPRPDADRSRRRPPSSRRAVRCADHQRCARRPPRARRGGVAAARADSTTDTRRLGRRHAGELHASSSGDTSSASSAGR